MRVIKHGLASLAMFLSFAHTWAIIAGGIAILALGATGFLIPVAMAMMLPYCLFAFFGSPIAKWFAKVATTLRA